MAVVKFSDLPILNTSLDLQNHKFVVHDQSSAPGSKTRRASIQDLVDAIPIKPLSSQKITMVGNITLSINSPNFIALDPNGQDRTVLFPNPNPSIVKQIFIFSLDTSNKITLLNFNDQSPFSSIGGDSSVSHVRAFSIVNDWFVIQGVS